LGANRPYPREITAEAIDQDKFQKSYRFSVAQRFSAAMGAARFICFSR
jgi:hypothetical protein